MGDIVPVRIGQVFGDLAQLVGRVNPGELGRVGDLLDRGGYFQSPTVFACRGKGSSRSGQSRHLARCPHRHAQQGSIPHKFSACQLSLPHIIGQFINPGMVLFLLVHFPLLSWLAERLDFNDLVSPPSHSPTPS